MVSKALRLLGVKKWKYIACNLSEKLFHSSIMSMNISNNKCFACNSRIFTVRIRFKTDPRARQDTVSPAVFLKCTKRQAHIRVNGG